MASADQVLRDCIRDGKLDGSYSNAELRKARDNLPSDSDEYSDCGEVIAAAIKGGSDRGSGAGSPGVGATDPAGEATARTADAGELAAIAPAARTTPPPWTSGARAWHPTAAGSSTSAAPQMRCRCPLLVALILLCSVRDGQRRGRSARARAGAGANPAPVEAPDLRVPFFQRRG